MIFRQLFEPLSSTYTYLLGCEETGQALLIDPVIVATDGDLAEINRLGLTLAYTMESHIHADHITGALELKKKTCSKIAAPTHYYKDRYVSSIAQEKKRNPRLWQERTLEQFKTMMANLNLPYPTFIDYAVPGNRQCGVCPCDLPGNLEKYCQQMTESRQG